MQNMFGKLPKRYATHMNETNIFAPFMTRELWRHVVYTHNLQVMILEIKPVPNSVKIM